METRRTEPFQDLGQRSGIVISLMSVAVGQVGDGESIASRKKVVHTRHPQRLEIQKMAGVFLGGPFRARSTDQHVARNAAEKLFEPRRSAPQANAQVGVLVNWKVELESPIKPGWNLTHAPTSGGLAMLSLLDPAAGRNQPSARK